ncbi:MAG: FKBP-type peptidyl-prolyl cis-trans isomerase [Immundisolibacter sp.]|uniref:FKBP-type peptidyl-prolyl cis-trans isomerase n=1 Tax=Immundisolibacter sp. TaxID=1934948 RepID=UPI003EDF25EF
MFRIALPMAIAAIFSTATLAADLTTDAKKAAYAIGYQFGANAKRDGLALDPTAVADGIKDALAGNKPAADPEVLQTALNKLRGELEAKAKAASDKNTRDGNAFRASYAKTPGVKKTASGLMYQVLTAGTGAKPTATDAVKVNYRGTLTDGTEFDSSYKRGEPVSFPVNQILPGWQEALVLMPEGSKWKIVLPPELAYGAKGAGGAIGPNQTLVFEIELLDIGNVETTGATP